MKRIALAVLLLCLVPLALMAGDPFPDKPSPNIVKPTVQFGTYGAGAGQFNDPTAVAVSRDNEIYIAECYNNRVQVFDRFGHSKRSWSGIGRGRLDCPQGIAVSEDGLVFVAESSDKIATFTKYGEYISSFGTHGDRFGELNDPTNLAVQRNKIYVTDQGNDRVQVFDFKGTPELDIGYEGSMNGAFEEPRSVAVDSDDNIYVVDDLDRVQKFDKDGQFIRSWGSYGGIPGQLAEPMDLSIVGDRLYVADTVNHRLQGFDLDGNVRLVWGRHPETAHEGYGYTHYPSSLKVSPDGTFSIVCEPFEYRCQIFDMATIRTVADNHSNAWWEKFPRFHYGGGLRVARAPLMTRVRARLAQLKVAGGAPLTAPREMMIITEPDLHRVVAFSLDTSVQQLALKAAQQKSTSVDLPVMYAIGSFGSKPGQFLTLASKKPLANGSLLIGDAGNNNIQQLDLVTGAWQRTLFKSGTGPGEFHGPSGIEEAPDGRILIGDFHNSRIQVFDKNFKFLYAFSKLGDAPGELFGPLSLAFDPSFKRLYVTDTGNQRIEVFDINGKFLFQFGHLTRPGQWGHGTFQWPFDVAVSPKGFVYVSDPSLQLVQKFDTNGKFLMQWGGWGTAPGQFYKPKGIDVDEEGNVYVIDFGNHRGQVFDENGKFLGIFGEGIMYPASLAPHH